MTTSAISNVRPISPYLQDPPYTSHSAKITPISDYLPSNTPNTSNTPDTSDNPSPVKTQTTQPITDPNILASIKSKLLSSSKKYGLRNYWIFQLGINIGLRCGDLLSILCQDVFDESTQSIKNPFFIIESKTQKRQMIALNDYLCEELKEYILSIPNRTPLTPLFPSQKTQPKISSNTHNGCLSTKSYYKIISNIGRDLGLEHLGTHTMRKTCFRAIYDQNKHTLTPEGFSALDIVQMIANHSSSNTTLRYIGITDEAKMRARKNLNL